MTRYQFDAYAALENLRDRYAAYLTDTFGIRSPQLAARLRDHWSERGDDHYPLLGPSLIQAAFPFASTHPLADLGRKTASERTDAAPLHPRTVAMLQRPLNFNLFGHQADAIRAASLGRTTVLSAGTGSGKTEAFLVSMIDALHWAEERGEDDLDQPGVRAVVIYPLNALVNNQIARMQQLLAQQTRVRFAFYTSRLPETNRAAKNWYTLRGFELPPACQLIDRRTVRGGEVPDDGRPGGPPHILVTNFSMLEYMLIRPLDRAFFLPHHLFSNGKARLRVIVLDEAHVYAGAQATEIHMLLRRAALRFGTTLEAVQGIATSATLAQGSDEASQRTALAEYGARMFAKSAEDVAVVLAKPVLPPAQVEPTNTGSLTAPSTGNELVPSHLRTLEFDEDGRPVAFVKDADAARAVATACVRLTIATERDVDRLPADERDVPALVAWRLLCTHKGVHELRARFHASMGSTLTTLDELATEVFGVSTAKEKRALDALLRLGAVARRRPDEHPLIPTRMHAWLRAPAGVWVEAPKKTTEADGWPLVQVRSSPPSDETAARSFFELAVCDTCGRDYLLAFLSKDDWQRDVYSGVEAAGSSPCAFARFAEGPDTLPWDALRGYRVALERSERGRLKGTCAFCRAPKTVFRRLVVSPRAALGALVDGLYPYLAVHPLADRSPDSRPGGGRRLLTFSDSRQEAARVAHDVELSHNVGLNRAVIYRALRRNQSRSLRITELIDDLAHDNSIGERAEAAEAGDARRRNVEFREKLAELGVYQELGRPAVDAATLEGLGLVELVYPDLPAAPAGLGLDQAEWEAFVASVLDVARAQGAVARASSDMPEDLRSRLPRFIDRPIVRTAPEMDDEDDEGAFRRRRFVALISPNRIARIRAYGEQVAARAGTPGGGERLLDAVWSALKDLSDRTRWLRWSTEPEGYLINLTRLSVRVHEQPPFIEPVTGRLFPRSVRGVAPVGAKPSEDLRPLSDEELAQWRARNAVRRAVDDEILGLATKEHTAQIDVDALDEAERAFRGGKTNLLACSTTMEMGVDLGGLTLVMMTNVPPAAANYWQRAGRAGRRADGSSLALSLARQLPHDQKVFRAPQAFLSEPMVPPQVRFDLPALLLRHVFAYLLAEFFEQAVVETSFGNPLRAFGTAGDFFSTPVGSDTVRATVLELAPDANSMADVFAAWLETIEDGGPTDQKLQRLRRGTVLAGRTANELALACRAAVTQTAAVVRRDLAIIEEQRAAQLALGEAAQDPTLLNALKYQERHVRNELLIAQLAKGDVLPRFGFPLDVVRLETKWKIPEHDEDSRTDREEDPSLRMERDLKLALSDYVPGTKVLAAKELHRSAGLVRNWHADDEDKARVGFYVHCASCGFLEERRTTGISPCTLCGHPVIERLGDAPDGADAEVGPTPIRQYLIPSSFAVKASERPERPDGFANPERMPPAFVFVSAAGRGANFVELGAGLCVGFEPATKVAFRSEGRLAQSGRRGFGYAVCQRCGRAEPEDGWDKATPPEAVRTPHAALRGRKRCSGNLWRRIALGTFGLVDTLRVRLLGPLAPRAVRRTDEEDFYMSLAVCVQELVAERIKVDRRTLSAAVGTWKAADGSVAREAIVWDPSTSGVLEHVLPDAADIICELVEKLEREPDLLSYVRFDNQFMVAQGRFRLDLLRTHFLDEVRRQHLPSRVPAADLPAEPRSEPLRSRAMEALEDATPPVSLIAPSLAADAFAGDGLLRIVHATQLRNSSGVRLLLQKPPCVDDPTQVALAGRLGSLIEAGAQVRVLSDPSAFATFARVLYTTRGTRRALGAVRRDVGTWKATDECFGATWGRGFVTVEAFGQHAESAFAAFEDAWKRAEGLEASALAPKTKSGIHYVAVRDGATGAEATSLAAILTKELGPPTDLGRVTRALYVDRYVARSGLATWNMFRTLEAFRYAPGALVRFRCLVPRGVGNRELVDVFRDRAWEALSPKEVGRFCEAFANVSKADARMDDVLDREEGGAQMRHGRKLLIEFEASSKLQSLKIDLEGGMDWIRATPPRNWNRATFTARETHFVIIEDHNLEAERDAQGKSEWFDIFGAQGVTTAAKAVTRQRGAR